MRQTQLFEAARRAVPLPALWQDYNLPLRKKGERFETPFTPCCGMASRPDAGSLFMQRNGEWRWHCFRCGQGGSAVDLVAEQEGLTPTEAAKKLVANAGGYVAILGHEPPKPKPRITRDARQQAVEKTLSLIAGRDGIAPEVMGYLANVRGISTDVVQEAHERGMLRTLPAHPDGADVWLSLNVGCDLLREAGMLRPTARRPAIAYRPLVFLPPGGTCAEFRVAKRDFDGPKALQYGRQTWPLVWHPRGEVRKVLVVEGGIDLLSCVSLGFATDTLILGLLGVSAWRTEWAQRIQRRYPNATWQIGFDADRAGESKAPDVIEALAEAGVQAERLAPWGGGEDWNDTLRAALNSGCF